MNWDLLAFQPKRQRNYKLSCGNSWTIESWGRPIHKGWWGCCILNARGRFHKKCQKRIKRYLKMIHGYLYQDKKKHFTTPFYGRGSTASMLQPLWGGSLLFTIKFPEIPGAHFMDLRSMKGWVDLGATQWFSTRDP